MIEEPNTKLFGFELFTCDSDWFPHPGDPVIILDRREGGMERGVFTHFVYDTLWFKMDSNSTWGLPLPCSAESLVKKGIPLQYAEIIASRTKLIYVNYK